jgi:hypothetical protein
MNIAKQAKIVTKQLEEMIRNADLELPEHAQMPKHQEKVFAGYNWQTYDVEPVYAQAKGTMAHEFTMRPITEPLYQHVKLPLVAVVVDAVIDEVARKFEPTYGIGTLAERTA